MTVDAKEVRLRPRAAALLRVLLWLLVSLALHALLLGVLPHWPMRVAATPPPLTAILLEPPHSDAVPTPAPQPHHRAPPAAKPSAPPRAPTADRPAEPRAMAQTEPRAEAQAEAQVQPPPTALLPSSSTPGAIDAQGGAASPAGGAGGAQALAAGTAPAAASPAPPLPAVAAPPAARPSDAVLEYDVVALDPKKPDQSLVGAGTLTFRSADDGYRASLNASVTLLFFSVAILASESDGRIGVDGLEPMHYAETPRNKPTAITTIARDAQGVPGLVTHSGSQEVGSAPPGVQDRLSVLLQLGGLVRSDPALRAEHARLAIPVAGVKGDIEIWNFDVLGREPVQMRDGRQDALHLARLTRPGTNDRGLDVWLGDSPPGVPLRVRYTEPGGATIDLTLASVS